MLVLFAIFLAVVIRFEGQLSAKYFYGFEWLFTLITLFCIGSYYFFGLYGKLWRYAGMAELKNIFYANLAAYLPFVMATIFTGGVYYSRSILVIAAILSFLFTGGIRFILRIVSEQTTECEVCKNVLIVGANDAGETVLREMIRGKLPGYMPVGFIDEDESKKDVKIHNVPVLGGIDDIPQIAKERLAQEIIIALPSPSLIQKVIAVCESIKVEFKVIPGLSEIIDGRVSVNAIRNVQIEDLLEREEIRPDDEPVREFLKDKTILVTGAGGSIGSELCRQVVTHDIKTLILLGRGENSIYEIALELKNSTDTPLIQFIGDIRDERRMETLMKRHRPDIVYHTAAHKHVPLMEENVPEAVVNNVLGTRNLMILSEKYKVESFTMLSTDKAVNPGSVMGATKRLAEMFMKSYSETPRNCRFSAVRFGNVLDSRGSVIPTFRRQIAMGGPVTVTHEKMTRFFMTIPEAVHLVIQASALGEKGEIFILDMGRPVRIMDLAQNLIRLSGFEPGKDIKIEIKGIRPGEKLEEELVNTGETTEPTGIKKILRVSTDTVPLDGMEKMLEDLRETANTGDDEKVREKLGEIVPNFGSEECRTSTGSRIT